MKAIATFMLLGFFAFLYWISLQAADGVTKPAAFVVKADQVYDLKVGAFGCLSRYDFRDMALNHRNREWTAFYERTYGKRVGCFYIDDKSPTKVTVLEVRDDYIRVRLHEWHLQGEVLKDRSFFTSIHLISQNSE